MLKLLWVSRPFRKRRKGRARKRWEDGMEIDLNELGVRDLRLRAVERDE